MLFHLVCVGYLTTDSKRALRVTVAWLELKEETVHLLFCALVLFQASSTQTDWVSGPGTPGPVNDFGLAFYSSDSVSYNITGQISPVTNSVTYSAWVKHVIEKNNSIRGHGGLYPADFDNDGDLDLVGWMTGCCTLRFYRNDMRGDTANFVKVASYPTPKPSQYPTTGRGFLWAGDLDGDGLADVAVPGESIMVCYKNLGAFTFRCCTLGFIREASPFCEGVDVDRDGRVDIIEGDSALTVWHNLGNMQFRRDSFGVGVWYKLKTGDLNNDGYPDLLSGAHVHLSNNGVFSMPPTWNGNLTGVDGVWVRDYNNDGRADLLVCDQWASTPGIYWYENLDSGVNYRQHVVDRSSHAQRYGDGACAEDVDLNGLADVVGSYSRVGFYRQTGRDTFVETQVDTITDSHWVLARNLDYRPNGSDCDIDILASTSKQFAWWENRMINRTASRCTLVSSILDAGQPSVWRRLAWDAARPTGTGLDFYVRTGASVAQLQSRPWQGPISVVTGREFDTVSVADYTTSGDQYFQYEVRMAGTNAIPAVYSVCVIYDAVIVDVATQVIVAPNGTVRRGTVTPEVRVRNFGTIRGPATVLLRIPAAGYAETRVLPGGLPFDDTTLRFTEWNADTGHFVCCCSTGSNADVNPANDTLSSNVVVVVSFPRWVRRSDILGGNRFKRAKDGGALAYNAEEDGGAIYALKGNNTTEFFRYDAWTDRWTTRESVPALGRSSKKKMVKKGATLAQADYRVFAAKGNNTREWWQYTPGRDAGVWAQRADVPQGKKALKEGAGSATVVVGGVPYVYLLKGSGTLEFYRYNPANDGWETMAPAPAGASRKEFKNGSCLAAEPNSNTIYALKGSYNEFFAYDVSGNSWVTRDTLPKVSPPGNKKKKVKDGAGIACYGDFVYALKGGNTYEFWKYYVPSNRWFPAEDILSGPALKRVKGGGALVYAPCKGNLYALKGNNTWEFYMYWLSDSIMSDQGDKPGATAGPARPVAGRIEIAPNPLSDRTLVRFALDAPGSASIKLYDIAGNLVRTISDGFLPAGTHSVILTRGNLTAGIYVVRYRSGKHTSSEKLVID
jgi:hypothetical protein